MELNLLNLASRPALKGIAKTKNDTRKCHIMELEDELIIHFMSFLSLTPLMNLANTCQRMNKLSATPVLWERLDLQDAFLKPGKLEYILERNPKYMRLARAKIVEPQQEIATVLRFSADYLILSYLDLSNADISQDTLSALLFHCDKLTKLSLEGLTLGADLFQMVTRKLKVLNLTMASNLYLPYFTSYLRKTQLKILNVCWIVEAKQWTEYGFMNLIQSLPKTLLHLNISGYSKLMCDLHVAVIVERCSLLERLDISDSHLLTPKCVPDIARLQSLNCLAMNRCLRVGLVPLKPLKNLMFLKHIEISGFTSTNCPAEKIADWLDVRVNCCPFLNTGRPTSESHPDYIWGRLISVHHD